MKVIRVDNSLLSTFQSWKEQDFFSGESWCDCYDERLQRFLIADDQDKFVGRFVAFEGGKAGMKTLITPPFSPHIGLFAEDQKSNLVKTNSFRKQVMDAIADFLNASGYVYYKIDFAPEWNDMQPLLWKKIHAEVRYTYRIDLHRTVAEITGSLDANKRNKINKAIRQGITVSHEPDIPLALNMLSASLDKKSIALHPTILEKILRLTSDESHGIWTITYSEAKPVAINICLQARNTCYNLLSAIDRKAGHNHGGTYSLYNSILKAKEKELRVFDFEGSGVPEIEEFFRSFGGELTPYFSATGGKWPWPMILRWKQKKGSA